jgi:iron complex outermembrane receptor protein
MKGTTSCDRAEYEPCRSRLWRGGLYARCIGAGLCVALSWLALSAVACVAAEIEPQSVHQGETESAAAETSSTRQTSQAASVDQDVSTESSAPVDQTQPAPSNRLAASLSDMGLEDLMSLEVTTVSRQESTVGQSPAAVFVITQEMIRRSGATTIPELFRMVPGMNVARTSGGGWAVSARGFNGNLADKLLVQVDGRTVYNPVFSGVYWDTVDYPLEDIERIEVVRGPGASVWGANAVNGIINIITKNAADTQGTLVKAGVGNEERALGVFRYGGQGGKDWNYRVYTKGLKRDEQYSATGDAHDAWQHGQGGFRIDRQASERDSMTLQGDYYDSDVQGLSLKPTLAAPFLVLNRDTEHSNGENLLFRWSREADKARGWQLQAYYDRFQRKSENGYLGFDAQTFDLDFQHRMPLSKRHKFIYGFGYRTVDFSFRDSIPDNGFSANFPDHQSTTHLLSAFAQDEFTLKPDKLTFTLGSKFEHNSFTGFEVEPTARLLWTPTPRQSVWAAASRAVRTPDFIERGLNFAQVTGPGLALILVASPDFDSETVKAYELGYRTQLTDRFSLDTALFYNDYDNLKAIDAGTPTIGPPPGVLVIPLLSTNQMTGHTYGLEASATWQKSERWQLYAAYSFLKMDLRPSSAINPNLRPTDDAAEGQSPRHQLYVRSSWDISNKLQFDIDGRYVSRLTRTSAPVKSYVEMDVRLGWKPRGDDSLELSIVGQNLLHDHHDEFGTGVEIQRGIYGIVTFRH